MTSADRLDNLGRVPFPLEILLAHGLFDAVDLVLITLSVAHRTLFSLLQGCKWDYGKGDSTNSPKELTSVYGVGTTTNLFLDFSLVPWSRGGVSLA